MAEWRFDLDGSTVSNPNDWRGQTFTLGKTDDLNGIIEKHTVPAIFSGSAYDAINSAWVAEYGGKMDVEIYERCGTFDAWELSVEGILPLPDCRFNLMKCLVEANILQNGYEQAIANNIDIKFHIEVGRSKNDSTITAASSISTTFFRPSTGAFSYGSREAYTVFEAFKFLVAAMTDGAVGFASPVFDAGGEWEGLCILTGDSLRQGALSTAPHPYISFAELFADVYKKINVIFWFDNSSGSPVLTIDYVGDFYGTSTMNVSVDNAVNIERSIDLDAMYAKVKVGSSTTEESGGGTFQWPDLLFLSHKDEEFHLTTESNTGAELDLVNDFVIDSNVIEDVLVNAVTSYDEDIFLVEIDLGTLRAIQYDTFNIGAAPYYYNRMLANDAVIARHLMGIPASLAQYVGSGNDLCEVDRTASTSYTANFLSTLWDFDNEISDPNNNFDNTAGNYKYTAPVTGFYRFKYDQPFIVQIIGLVGGVGADMDVDIELRRYNAAAVLQETKTGQLNVNVTALGAVTLNYTGILGAYQSFLGSAQSFQGNFFLSPLGFYMATTDYVQIYVSFTINVGQFKLTLDEGEFRCIEATTGGGEFASADPDNALLILYKFQHPLSISDYESIKSQQSSLLPFTGASDGITRYGYIESIDFRPEEGQADFTLRTSAQRQFNVND